MTTIPQSLAENEGVAANVEDPRVAAIAEAMRQKRKDLIYQPLVFIWDDLARAALSALRSRDSVESLIDAALENAEDVLADGNRSHDWLVGYRMALEGLRMALPLSSHEETAGGWRPIETAPKDGSSILGAYFDQPRSESHREGRIVTCWYQPEFESFISGCREMTLARGYTFEDGTSRQLHSPDKEDITHWMPLPPPPQSPAMIKAAKGGEK